MIKEHDKGTWSQALVSFCCLLFNLSIMLLVSLIQTVIPIGVYWWHGIDLLVILDLEIINFRVSHKSKQKRHVFILLAKLSKKRLLQVLPQLSFLSKCVFFCFFLAKWVRNRYFFACFQSKWVCGKCQPLS